MKKLFALFFILSSINGFAADDEWIDVDNGELVTLIKGKSISAEIVTGGSGSVNLQFSEDGKLFGKHNSGGTDSGKWRIEGSKLCLTWRRFTYEGCGLIQKKGSKYQHLYPDGKKHLDFKAN